MDAQIRVVQVEYSLVTFGYLQRSNRRECCTPSCTDGCSGGSSTLGAIAAPKRGWERAAIAETLRPLHHVCTTRTPGMQKIPGFPGFLKAQVGSHVPTPIHSWTCTQSAPRFANQCNSADCL